MNNLNLLGQLTAPTTVGSGVLLGVGFVFFIIGLLVSLILQLRRRQNDDDDSELQLLLSQYLAASQGLRLSEPPPKHPNSYRSTPMQAGNNPDRPHRNLTQELRDRGMTAEQAEQCLVTEVEAVLLENRQEIEHLRACEATPRSQSKAQQSSQVCESCAASSDAACQSKRQTNQIPAPQPRRRWQILRRLGQALKAKFRVAVAYAPTPNEKS